MATTKTLLELDQLLLEAISDYISVATTTNITTNKMIISTTLNQYDMARDDYFNNWWVYLNTTNNASVDRKVKDYTTATGQLEVYGANLAAETGATTIYLSRYSRNHRELAIKRAIEEIFPTLHLKIEDRSLVTGNILPNSHFEDWTSSSYPDKYNKINATVAETTAAGLIRGSSGTSSALVSPSAADGYMFITSGNTTDAGHPRLLDLMGQTISFKCWAYPSTADDAFLTIYTVKADGTAQTLSSTTTCPASKWTLLELEDQDINDDIVEIQFRFRVSTNGQTCYFDNARVTGRSVHEYRLPLSFQGGIINQIDIQSGGYSDDICDDIHPTNWEPVYGSDLIHDGTDLWLRLPLTYGDNRQIRLIGRGDLETLSTDTSTITMDKTGRTNVLIAYAAHKLFQIVKGLPSTADVARYDDLSNQWLATYYRLSSQLKMPIGAMRMNLPSI